MGVPLLQKVNIWNLFRRLIYFLSLNLLHHLRTNFRLTSLFSENFKTPLKYICIDRLILLIFPLNFMAKTAEWKKCILGVLVCAACVLSAREVKIEFIKMASSETTSKFNRFDGLFFVHFGPSILTEHCIFFILYSCLPIKHELS